jgi:heptosyltransferase-2
VYQKMEEVTDIIEIPLRHGELNLIELIKTGRQLKNKQYSQAYILPRSLKASFIPYFADIPERIGFLGEYRYGLINKVKPYNTALLDQTVKRFTSLGTNEDDSHLKVCRPKLQASSERANELLVSKGLTPSSSFIAIAPGAEYGPSKQWPADYFSRVIQYIIDAGLEVVMLGSKKDKAIEAVINRHYLGTKQPLSFIGDLDLEDSIDLLSLAKALVTNDSGLMHVGAALDIPIIAIYGSTSPKFTPPIARSYKIHWLNLDCGPCFKRECPLHHLECLKGITPDNVFISLKGLINLHS